MREEAKGADVSLSSFTGAMNSPRLSRRASPPEKKSLIGEHGRYRIIRIEMLSVKRSAPEKREKARLDIVIVNHGEAH